ncbi:MAG: histidinol-phosphate transaminase [Halanaerobiales bacterium]
MSKEEKKEQNKGWKKSLREEINNIKPYIPGKPIKEVKDELGLEKVIKLASNENPLPTSTKVKEAVNEEMERVNLYPDGASRNLKDVLCANLNVESDMVALGNGSDGLIKVIGETFLDRSSQVIISYPSFVEYQFVAQLMGCHLVRVWMKNYKQNIEGIIKASSRKTNMIFLTSPDNPTGTIIEKPELEKLLDELPDDIIVVLDEAYHEYVQSADYPNGIDYVKQGYPVIVLRTFSKAYGLAGLRLGYAVAQPEIITSLMKARDPFNVNRIAETAGKAVLEDEEFLNKTIANNEQGKKYLYQELDNLGLEYIPTEANFILVNVKTNSTQLFENMLKRGIIIRPGKPLGYPGHIRITIGTPEENEALITELKKELKK